MKVVKHISLIRAGRRYAYSEELAFAFKREIEEKFGGPPAGAEFLVLDGNELVLEYVPFSKEAVEYAATVMGYLDDTT